MTYFEGDLIKLLTIIAIQGLSAAEGGQLRAGTDPPLDRDIEAVLKKMLKDYEITGISKTDKK